MFGIGYFKGLPNEYVIKYISGRIARKGTGISFFYMKYNTQIIAIPTSSKDANFVFNEVSGNFQTVIIQGQFTYKISEPEEAHSLINFTIEPRFRKYISDDPIKLPQRISNVIQMETRREIRKRSLEEILKDSQLISEEVIKNIKEKKLLGEMGVELLDIYFLSIKPAPEIAKALEADYRETLLRKADEAIYARRAAAVEEERKIKEKELNTDITIEEQRAKLIEMEGKNAQEKAEYEGIALEKESSYRAKALEMELELYKKMDPRIILALGLKELGKNSEKIGNLTITSEILASLMNSSGGNRA